jgi:hypothetical protein
MIDYVLRALRENPELAVFLTLALGFVVGRVDSCRTRSRASGISSNG